MSREVVVKCDVCGQIVSDVLRDDDKRSLRHDGYGYIEAKRITWRFGPWPKFWHREDLGWEIVCDLCLDTVREIRTAALRGQE